LGSDDETGPAGSTLVWTGSNRAHARAPDDREAKTMRFMVMGKATADSEAGAPPSAAAFEEMSRYNEQLVRAGVLVAADGLHPSSKGRSGPVGG
jgi:hypothetical protein